MSSSLHRHPYEVLLLGVIAILSFFAVLAYGLTTDDTCEVFDLGLAFLFGFWGVGLAIQKRWPHIHWLAWVFPLLIIGYGWVSVANAKFTHSWEAGGNFFPIEDSWGINWLWGTTDLSISFQSMAHISLLFCGFWVVVDLSRSRTNRRYLMSILALAGLLISLIGIFQKASGSQTMLFFDELLTERRFFASYRYHGNAATLLNFTWPLALILLLRAKVKDAGPILTAIWGSASFFTLAAVLVNTSKVGQTLGVLMVGVFIIFYRKTLMQLIRNHPRPVIAGGIVGVIVLALVTGLVALSFSTSVSRWEDFQSSFDARIQTYKVCLVIIESGGPWGYGPGVFPTVFPYHAADQEVDLDVFWNTAHQDYLQTVIEWGVAGALLWGCFVGGVFVRGLKLFIRGDFYAGAISIGLLASLIQGTVDFPAQIASLQWVALVLLALVSGPKVTKRK